MIEWFKWFFKIGWRQTNSTIYQGVIIETYENLKTKEVKVTTFVLPK